MFFVNKKLKNTLLKKDNGEKIVELLNYAYFKLFKQNVFIEDQIYKILQKVVSLDAENEAWFKNISSKFSNFLINEQKKMELFLFNDNIEQIETKLNEAVYFSRKIMLNMYREISFKYYEITSENLQTSSDTKNYMEWSQMHEFKKQIMLDYHNFPYQILGVEKNATKAEIKKAYLSLSKRFHPDFNKSVYAEEIMLVINNAYEQLKDL